MRISSPAVVSLSLVAMLGLAGCASQPSSAASKAAAPASAPSAVRTSPAWPTSRAATPRSFPELMRGSDLVVTGTVAEGAGRESVHGVPFTIRTVTVDGSWKGRPPATVKVRELGDGLEPTSLQPGSRHVLFLQRFEFTRGAPTDQYVIVGAFTGDYRIEPDGTAARVDPEGADLPARTTLAQIAAAARA